MKLILINGLPCTGKTTLAKKLSKQLHIPHFIKDDFKEILYDEIGYTTPEEKKQFEITALQNIYYIFEKFAQNNSSVILEANFYSEFSTEIFNNFSKKYDFEIIQILCRTEGKKLYKRFLERADSGTRHPGHGELSQEVVEKWKQQYLIGKWEKLHVGGKYIELDTTDFETIDYEELYIKLAEE